MQIGRDPAGGRRLRVVHYARTALAVAEIATAIPQAGADLICVDNFEAFLTEVAQADLLLLTDPGADHVHRLAAAVARVAPRPVAVHVLSAGREGFAGWVLPGHVTLTGVGSALARTVAEHALALILSLLRGLHGATPLKAPPPLRSLEGARLLVLGCGQIGQHVARCARPFGPYLIGLNRSPASSDLWDETGALSACDSYLPTADIVVLCLPLTKATQHLIGPAQIAAMRKGAIVINVGRGGVLDEDALAAALTAGHLGGAGLDVFATEPLPATSPLWSAPHTILTPHIAGLGGAGEQRIALSARKALDDLRARLGGQP